MTSKGLRQYDQRVEGHKATTMPDADAKAEAMVPATAKGIEELGSKPTWRTSVTTKDQAYLTERWKVESIDPGVPNGEQSYDHARRRRQSRSDRADLG